MEHDDYVKIVIKKVEEAGAKVYAHNIDGYGNPAEIGGYMPDVSADFSDGRRTYEIETAESISTDHTKKQCMAFANNAKYFVICIPKAHESEMKQNLSNWGIALKTKIMLL